VTTAVVVLSGKGGTAKTLWQLTMAGEASRAGLKTLLIDMDPERNLSNRFGIPQHSTGVGDVLHAAGVLAGGELDVAAGAERLATEVVSTAWANLDLVPAGAQLGGISQVQISEHWLMRDMLDAASLANSYDLILFDTAGRTGSLVSLAMYGADVAYAPISPTTDAVRKAIEAHSRVERIQRAHPLRWAGVVLSGFDLRVGIDEAIRDEARQHFGDEIRAEVPRRATVHEAFQVCERLGDRPDVVSAGMAKVFRTFLMEDLIGQTTRVVATGAAR
jgi:chromosome partitioning protein